MEVILLLLPVSVVIIAIAIAVFVWAVDNGQYEDTDRQGDAALFDDLGQPPSRSNETQQPRA